jgi:hypothetical protein
MQNEWVVNFGCTHHLDKDASLFMWLDEAKERKIYITRDFALDFVSQGDVIYQNGKIVNIYHVSNLSTNLFFIAQLTQTSKIVEFYPYRLYVHDLKKGRSIIVDGLLDPTSSLYKFSYMNQPDTESTTLISHTNEISQIFHERLEHLNFQSL